MSNPPSSYDIPQQQGAYYYAPLQDNGPFEQRLKEVGEVLGSYVAHALVDADSGGATEWNPAVNHAVDEAGEFVGGIVGQTIGFYVDNASTIVQNANTFIEQMNDLKTWSDPFSDALLGQ